jgi:putative membrane protein
MRNTKLWINLLWVLVVVLVVARLANTLFGFASVIPLVLLGAVFALIHGTLRYRWSGVLTFLAITLVVSNVLENLSIMTGFPFGHYHYTGGGKLFLVPVFIGPSYFAIGYLAWMLAVVLVGDIRRNGSWFNTIVVPLVGAAVMVMWDLTFDPTASTVQHQWIWDQGGGYFGVPLTNYLGWFLTVYLIFQVFALFLRFRGTRDESQPLPRSFHAQAIVLYAEVGLTAVLSYLVLSGNQLVTDAAGVVWQTRSIAEAEATVSIFTMIFIAGLTAVKLLQAANRIPDAKTDDLLTKTTTIAA